jgi:three-Cys-motif partner protein
MSVSRIAASWPLAPHTGAKLALLGAYLRAWFPILGSTEPQRVFYIDGFAGPGRYSGGEDGSPIVALKALGLRGNLAKTTFEFHFVERRRRQAEALRNNIDALHAQKLVPHNAIINFHNQSAFADVYKTTIAPQLDRYPGAPTFALVDPFGWTGLPMMIMRDLMRRQRTEVMVNFMFEEINRFLSHPD